MKSCGEVFLLHIGLTPDGGMSETALDNLEGKVAQCHQQNQYRDGLTSCQNCSSHPEVSTG